MEGPLCLRSNKILFTLNLLIGLLYPSLQWRDVAMEPWRVQQYVRGGLSVMTDHRLHTAAR